MSTISFRRAFNTCLLSPALRSPRESSGGSGPMRDRASAEVQMGFILTKLAALGTDQGVTVNVAQIVYEWVED